MPPLVPPDQSPTPKRAPTKRRGRPSREALEREYAAWCEQRGLTAEEIELRKTNPTVLFDALREEYAQHKAKLRAKQKNKGGYNKTKVKGHKGIWKLPSGSLNKYTVSYRQNGKQYWAQFSDLDSAKEFRADRARLKARKEANLTPTYSDRQKPHVSELLDWYLYIYLDKYLDPPNPARKLKEYDIIVAAYRHHYLFFKPVIDVKEEDIYDLIRVYKDHGNARETIVRYLGIFRRAINLAKKRHSAWKELNLPNPFSGQWFGTTIPTRGIVCCRKESSPRYSVPAKII
jgi:hypothetical protein